MVEGLEKAEKNDLTDDANEINSQNSAKKNPMVKRIEIRAEFKEKVLDSITDRECSFVLCTSPGHTLLLSIISIVGGILCTICFVLALFNEKRVEAMEYVFFITFSLTQLFLMVSLFTSNRLRSLKNPPKFELDGKYSNWIRDNERILFGVIAVISVILYGCFFYLLSKNYCVTGCSEQSSSTTEKPSTMYHILNI